MVYVYILRSKTVLGKYYVGFTKDIQKRLVQHNTNPTSNHMAKYGPWEVITYLAFSDENKARKFKKYFKSPSGKAFFKKRLV